MKIKNFKLVKSWPLLVVFLALWIFLPNQTLAVNAFIQLIGDTIWSFFVYPMIWALNLLLELLKLVASYNNFTKEGGVTIGWIALRDLSNMFFILIFLVIAFATILRISGYGYNELLRRTIIIAILINFSKTIVGFIIDVSQVVMLTFISAVNEALTGGVVVAVGLHKLATLDPSASNGMAFTDYVVSLVMGAILIAILLVVIGIMVMMLTMRIVALWVAIVLSPLAFLADIFPATKSFYNTWLKQLGANLVTGPMLAFFLWLTFTIVANGNAYTTFMNSSETASTGATEFLATSNLVNYIVAISLLLMGIKVAASSGAAGANIASKGMGMIKNTAGKLARRYPMALAQRAGAFAAGALVDKDGKAKTLANFANTKFGKKVGLATFSKKYQDKREVLKQSDSRLGRMAGGLMSATWSKVPFYGGRAQRTAMNIKGINAQRIAREKAEDEKNILPQHRVAFEKTYAEGAANKTWYGKAYSKIGSWGGDTERQAMMYENMLARGEINTGNADAATNALRDIGNEAGMEQIQSSYWTFKDKKEAMRIIEKKGLGGLLSNVKTGNLYENVFDDKGRPVMEKYIDPETGEEKERQKVQAKQSTINALEAIASPEHGHADHNSIASYILKWSKDDRGTLMSLVKDNFDFAKHFGSEAALNVANGAEIDKRNFIPSNLSNIATMWAQVQGKIYPQMMGNEVDANGNIIRLGADRYYHARARKDLLESYIQPGQVATRLKQLPGETSQQFKQRKKHAAALDAINFNDPNSIDPLLKDRFVKKDASGKEVIDKEKLADYRKDMYKQIVGLKAYTENLAGEKRSDFHNNDHIYAGRNLSNERDIEEVAEQITRKWTAPDTVRGDLFKQGGAAKEDDGTYNARKEVEIRKLADQDLERKDFKTDEEYEEYTEKLETRKNLVKQILSLRMEDFDPDFDEKFGEGAWLAEKRRMVAEIVGDKRTSEDLVSRSIWGEIDDGMHGSRMAEVNTGNIHEAVMLDHAIASSENQQQSQAFQVSTPEQTQYIVDKLAEFGKQPQKVLLENIPKELAAVALQKFNDIKALQEGTLPQNLALLGADLRKLSVVLKKMADVQKITVPQLLAKDTALNEYIESLKKVHAGNTNIDIDKSLVIDDAPVGQNSKALQDILDHTKYEVQDAGYLSKNDSSKSTGSSKTDKKDSTIITENIEEEFKKSKK